MAHIVTGIDIGTYSVKFVLIDVGFRHSRVHSTFEEPVARGDGTLLERQTEALRLGLGRLGGERTIYTALPGEALAIRVLDIPFSDPRKVEQVVGFELEGQIVHSLTDVVFDHVILDSKPVTGGSAVLAVAARIDEVGGFLETLRALDAEPQALYAAPIVYQSLSNRKKSPAGEPPSCRVLLDIGHRHTNVCVRLDGETIMARAVTRAGSQMTAAIASAFGATWEQAEQAKHDQGFIGSGRRPAVGPMQEQMTRALSAALEPWVREMRLTLAHVRGRIKTPIEAIELVGGGSLIEGLAEFVEEQLELPVLPFGKDVNRAAPQPAGDDLTPFGDATVVTSQTEEMDLLEEDAMSGEERRFLLARAIAEAGARGSKEIDLRRGPFVFKANFSILRQKAAHLSMLGLAIIAAIAIDATVSLSRLSKERTQLEAQLKIATLDLFGTARTDAKSVASELRRSFRDDMAPIPKATAFDLLNQISRKVPSADQVKLDVLELDIRPKKTFIKATADSQTGIDDLVARLNTIDCFDEVTKGRVEEIASGSKQFTLTIASKCP